MITFLSSFFFIIQTSTQAIRAHKVSYKKKDEMKTFMMKWNKDLQVARTLLDIMIIGTSYNSIL